MALIDYNNIYSSAQAVTTSAASTNYIDGRASGEALESDLYLVVQANAAFTGGTSLDIQFQTATDAAFTTPVVLYDSSAILTASLTANKVLCQVPIPIGLLRYTRVYYTVVGTMTGGTVTAFIQKGVFVAP